MIIIYVMYNKNFPLILRFSVKSVGGRTCAAFGGPITAWLSAQDVSQLLPKKYCHFGTRKVIMCIRDYTTVCVDDGSVIGQKASRLFWLWMTSQSKHCFHKLTLQIKFPRNTAKNVFPNVLTFLTVSPVFFRRC